MKANRILREVVDIHCFGELEASAARRIIDKDCSDRLTRAIGLLLDSWGVPEDQIISIDRLEVKVSGIHHRDVEAMLIPQIVSGIEAELAANIGPAGAIKPELLRPVSRSVMAEVLFFLEHGYLPWSSAGDHEWVVAAADAFTKISVDDQSALTKVLKSSEARQRMVCHFPVETMDVVVWASRGDDRWKRILSDVESMLGEISEDSRRSRIASQTRGILLDAVLNTQGNDAAGLCDRLAQLFVRVSISELPKNVGREVGSRFGLIHFESPLLREALCQAEMSLENRKVSEAEKMTAVTPASPGARQPSVARQPLEKGERSPSARALGSTIVLPHVREGQRNVDARPSWDEETIYIRNGGLVILAAYLPTFFRRLELADDKHLLKLPTALALMHYLVFGTEDCAEWDFALGKILCGVSLMEAIETPPPMEPFQKEEAQKLLTAVIANWSALKNTSPDALRATFLQREGALRPRGTDWELRLVRTGFDVLIDRLPWTISMIRLPWMPGVLYTDWAS